MIRVGGNSYSNGIQFSSDKYNVYFKSNNNKSKIFLRENKGLNKEVNNKFFKFLSKIPIIRGILDIFGIDKLFVLAYISMLLSDIMLSKQTIASQETKNINIIISIISLIISLSILICSLVLILKIFKNIKATFQYHAAEHKVIYTYKRKKAINLNNCTSSPRVNDCCGTMLLCFMLIVYMFILIITNVLNINLWFSTKILITIGIADELFRVKSNLPVIRWIYKFGGLLQKYLFTREPNRIQLKQAMDAFKILEKAETGKYSQEEINSLIKQGLEIQY